MITNKHFWVSDFNRASNYVPKYPTVAKIFDYPSAIWLTGRSKYRHLIDRSVKRTMKRATPYFPTFVLYAIPNRDLGHHSAGGMANDEEYFRFCRRIAAGIGNKSPVVIIEPDALPHSTLQTPAEQMHRIALIKKAVQILSSNCDAIIYIDIGHSGWLSPSDSYDLLMQAGVMQTRGFSINVSNYRTTEDSLIWGSRIASGFEDDKFFIIDTSRNGVGPLDNCWCNPPERGLGERPSLDTASRFCDAYMWLKVPGESDGKCNGGPAAGKFWPEKAEELVRNSPFM
jgi:endoglucanase